MATYTLGTYRIYEHEQEEIIETNLVADPETGIVEEVTTLIQPYMHLWADFTVTQDTLDNENMSVIKGTITLNATAGENSDGCTLVAYGSKYSNPGGCAIRIGESSFYSNHYDTKDYTLTAAPGETVSRNIVTFYSDHVFCGNNTSGEDLEIYHNFDGSLTHFRYHTASGWTKFNLNFDVICDFSFTGDLNGTAVTKKSISNTVTGIAPTYMPTNRGLIPTTANSFTDEENPSFGYKVNTPYYAYNSTKSNTSYKTRQEDTPSEVQAALSFDGETIDIEYREIPVDGTSYTFNLTAAEREKLQQKAQGSSTVPIYYVTKILREDVSENLSQEFINKTQRYLTIVGCDPQLNPTVKDIKPETLALTGDENTFIRYESMAEYAFNATASKGATIVSQSVQCGSKTISNLPNGVIDDVESGTFIFNITDSRSMGASSSVFKNLVEYVKPTCYQKLEIEISGETGANIKVTVNGNYYNGSFGAADNTLKLEVRYTDGNDNWGAWQALSGTPTYNGTTYKLENKLTGFNYGKAYIFQCRATDKLNIVQSSQYTVRMLPVFDWSETDFNFNVPVNIDAEDLSMHGKTIIRHSDSTNNTVLSASNGNIYIRPKGTDDTSGETIFYGNGNVKFNGTVTFADGSTGGGASDPTDAFADYVIEIGEEAMGSNGTWYWRKWNSGKSECWGCRNFGNMAVTTAWGNLYRSAVLTQDLPDNVFVRTPDSININIVHATFGGWICKHEQTAPSAATTGSFIFVRPASATVTAPTNIGFYIVGEWK